MAEVFNINDSVPKDSKEKNTTTVKKNLVILYASDSTGCGHIRSVFPYSFLGSIFGKPQTLLPLISPVFIFQHDLMVRARDLIFQRQMTGTHLDIIRKYKNMQAKYKYKMIYDIDDLLWGLNENQGGDKKHGIPSYNFASERIGMDEKVSSIEIMKLMDLVTVSTMQLANYLKDKIGGTQLKVVYNTVPKYLYGEDRRKPITEKIKKPKILYAGSPTHYSNRRRLPGDWDNRWVQYIIKQVKAEKILFYCMGGLPYVFDSIKEKVAIHEWVSSYHYALLLKRINPDFLIMPLINNYFNSCKSDVKYVEACAIGSIGIGSTFESGDPSPYDNNIVTIKDTATVEEIEKLIDECSEADVFNKIIKSQYDMLISQGRYTESPKYINSLVNML